MGEILFEFVNVKGFIVRNFTTEVSRVIVNRMKSKLGYQTADVTWHLPSRHETEMPSNSATVV